LPSPRRAPACLYDRIVHGTRAGWRVGIAAALILLGALPSELGPTSASALPLTPGARVSRSTTGQGPAPFPPGFVLRSSNGYGIAFYVLGGRKGSGPHALIIVGQKGRSVLYVAPATFTTDSLEVDLGELGRVAVAFHPTGATRPQRSACGGKPVSFASGYYEGTIAFHGEEGYTEVEATRARGDASIINIVCPGKSTSGRGPGLPGAELRVRPKKRPRTRPSLTVVENDPRAPVQLEVNVSERRNEIAIERSIRVKAPRTAFHYSSKLRTATLRPPRPFSGWASFRRTGRRTGRWMGNLTVDLPGRSGVRLTGRDLRASLFRAHFKGSGSLEEA
jgi:hypothetical protein